MLQRSWKIWLSLLLLNGSVFAQTPSDLSEATSLIYRFTGTEAVRLKSFLQERMDSELDASGVLYYGNLKSLACSEKNDCFLWLAAKEWQDASHGSQDFQIAFTLPVSDAILKSRLTVTTSTIGERNLSLELLDLQKPSATLSLQSNACGTVKGSKLPPLAYGDCRLELSNALKDVLPYPASSEFVQNAENIVVSFVGASAKKIYESMPDEVDPGIPTRRRIQLGPQFYCWNLQPELKNSPESYACQGNFIGTPSDGIFDFSSPVIYQGQPTHSDLQLNISNSIVSSIGLSIDGLPLGACPVYSKKGADRDCKILYNWKLSVDSYPVNPITQGIAVGWGLVPE